jgi:glutaminase
MSVCTVDGQRFSLGDVDIPFSLQSCSKPFSYAIALNELGHDVVHNYVSHEPSGRNFNEICLDSRSERNLNYLLDSPILPKLSRIVRQHFTSPFLFGLLTRGACNSLPKKSAFTNRAA